MENIPPTPPPGILQSWAFDMDFPSSGSRVASLEITKLLFRHFKDAI